MVTTNPLIIPRYNENKNGKPSLIVRMANEE
jgi:hypothetical protein